MTKGQQEYNKEYFKTRFLPQCRGLAESLFCAIDQDQPDDEIELLRKACKQGLSIYEAVAAVMVYRYKNRRAVGMAGPIIAKIAKENERNGAKPLDIKG